jgi:hypothetical protein
VRGGAADRVASTPIARLMLAPSAPSAIVAGQVQFGHACPWRATTMPSASVVLRRARARTRPRGVVIASQSFAMALPHRAVSQLCQRLEGEPSHYVNQDLETIWLDK